MHRGGSAVGDYLPSMFLQWWLLIVFVPDNADFPHDRLVLQVLELVIPALASSFLIAYCWRLWRVTDSTASTGSVMALVGASCFFGLITSVPTISDEFTWSTLLTGALTVLMLTKAVRQTVALQRAHVPSAVE